ncbi:MAG: hypothetical protein HYW57_07655, partial [Ignavibacteriales bacterium]|nr:hypothetical protein [Ignavibacteriales bacterium]
MRRSLLPILFFFCPLIALGQYSWTESFFPTGADSLILLSREFIVPESESLVLDSTIHLRRDDDYVVNYRYGEILLGSSVVNNTLRDGRPHRLDVFYQSYPMKLKRHYSLQRLDVRTDSAGKKEQVIVPSGPAFSVDDFFGDELQKSGSIFRGFSVGSNRDVSLNSGFRMQLAGKLSQDVDLVAALTDENSPIQPEGTTQTLQEVDKVFVELRHPTFGATLGDFNVAVRESQGGEFARVFRKLQGAQGQARSSGIFGSQWSGEVTVTGAAARGKYHTMTFQGREGNQGPYRLAGQNGERAIIIIAGTERVYLDGETMARGEILDYTIDYAAAEVTFMSRRLITNASRIIVDFEYTDRNYERNYAAATVQAGLLNEKIRINALVIQESDDPDAPVDVTLDDRARSILAQSGDDRFKASQSGVAFAGADSATGAGRGQYVRRDTTIGGKPYALFHYAPGDPNAFYTVRFSFVDQMPADSAGYVRIGLGQFVFAGVGRGNYLPIQFIPIPRLARVVDLNAAAQISQSLSVSGEYAVSQNDQNRLSAIDRHQSGQAVKLTARYREQEVAIGSAKLGELDASFSERYVDRKFVSLDRANEVEFGRKWNFDALPVGDEEIREASLLYRPTQAISVSAAYGSLERIGSFYATRTQGEAGLSDSSIAEIHYTIEDIKSTDDFLGRRSSWLRQRGKAERDIG